MEHPVLDDVKPIVIGTLKGLGTWLCTSSVGFSILNVGIRQYGPHFAKMGYEKQFKFALIPNQKPWKALPTLSAPLKVEAKIELHEARRAGDHLDLRFKINGRVYDFAVVKKTHLPKETGRPFKVVRRHNHSLRYFNTDRHVFPKGTYGEGKMQTIWRGEVDILFISNEKIEFEILDGEFKGRYCIFTEESEVMPETIIRMKDLEGQWKERRPFTDSQAALRRAHENQSDWIAEEKVDGSCTVIIPGPKGNVVMSRRIGVDGKPIYRQNHVPPTLKYWKFPEEYHGRRIHVELSAQEGGVTTTSGLLNSNPSKARDYQVEHDNHLIGYVWDIEPIDPDTSYSERRSEYRILVAKSPRIDNRAFGSVRDRFLLFRLTNPRVLKEVCGSDIHQEEPEKYSESLKANEFEGTVWKKKDGKYGEAEPWVKDKNETYIDMQIVGVVEGQGKYSGSLGAILVENTETGAVTSVGTGFTDELRDEIYKNQDDYIGKTVEVKGLQVNSSGRVRAPRFSRIKDD